MLLRASRASAQLTKEALVPRFLGATAAKAAKGIGKRLFTTRGLMAAGGTALTGAIAAPMIQQGLQRSRVGLSPQYIQAQKYGLVGPMRV